MKILTDEEMSLIELTADLWNNYLKLPEQHELDRQEFCQALHVVQHLIMIRGIRREMPEDFPIVFGDKTLGQQFSEQLTKALSEKILENNNIGS